MVALIVVAVPAVAPEALTVVALGTAPKATVGLVKAPMVVVTWAA